MDFSSPLAAKSRPTQPPLTPRRPSTSSGTPQRPSTSSGDKIEPTSALLRSALREQKSLPPRARSTTPRRARPTFRPQNPVQKDEWLQSSGDEMEPKERTVVARPRPRRMSEVSVATATAKNPVFSSSLNSSLGARETESKIDKLEKESWNLKHKIMLAEEKNRVLTEKLEEREEDRENLIEAHKIIDKLEDEKEALNEQLCAEEETNTELEADNIELTQMNNELIQEVELREKDIERLTNDNHDRQTAIEEAAGIIKTLEQRLVDLENQVRIHQQQASPPRQPDSDYFSGDAEAAAAVKPVTAPVQPRAVRTAPDSDYYSADTSPQVTPKGPKRSNASVDRIPAMESAQQTSTAFNKQVGLRSITSKESLLSNFLESPQLPQKTSGPSRFLQSLRRRAQSPKPEKEKVARRKSIKAAAVSSRPLRNLYMTGELGMQVGSSRSPVPPVAPSEVSTVASPYCATPVDGNSGPVKSSSTPSIVEQATSMMNPATLTHYAVQKVQGLHKRSNSTNSRPTSSSTTLVRQSTLPPLSPSTVRPSPRRVSSDTRRSSFGVSETAQGHAARLRAEIAASQRASTVEPVDFAPDDHGVNMSNKAAPSIGISRQYTAPAPTRASVGAPAPNYAMWPKRYPAWPPSAGLVNRDLLFHGQGMDEMFGSEAENEEHDGRHW